MLKPALFRHSKKQRQSKDINPYLRQVVKSFRPTFIAIFTFSFFINLLTLAVPIYLLQIYSKVIPSKSVDTLLYLTGIALVAILFLGILEALRRSLLVKSGSRFEFLIGEHLLNSAIHRSLAKSRTSINVLRDLTRIRNLISGTNLIPLLDVPWTPLFLLMLFALHPLIGAVGVVGTIIMIGLAIFNEIATRKLTENANDASKANIDDARSYVKNSHAVQAMGMQKHILPRWKQANTDMLNKGMDATSLNTRISSLSKSIRLCLQITVICVAAWLIVNDELTAGATIASVLLLRRAIAPLEGAIKSWKSIVASRQAFYSISEYLNHASTFDEHKPMPKPTGTLRAQNLSYRPSGHKKSLFSKASITIEPGNITALVGSTATGKSTVLKILCGIIPPSSGKVTLGGYELNQWDAETLGECVGYLPQDVALFPGTVRENIGRMADAPIDSVIKASTLANSHEMIQQLPRGYETMIAEDGENLSGGQKQRIGLARALYGNPVMVLLDEPDANLDSSGRSTLRKCLRKLKRKNIALLVISHHRSIEQAADVVYELDAGTIRKLDRSTRSNAKQKATAVITNETKNPVIEAPDTQATSGLFLHRTSDGKSDNALSILNNTKTQEAVNSKDPTEPTPAPAAELTPEPEQTPEERVSLALEKLSTMRHKREVTK